jgi:phage shock protein A
VLREKVGARIKEQARQHGPEVVRSAADTIAPRFEAIVDQFAQRLAEFVANAGEALHRGISEVLDQALTERQQRQKDAGAIRQELEAQLGRLQQLEDQLTKLREALWAAEGPLPGAHEAPVRPSGSPATPK